MVAFLGGRRWTGEPACSFGSAEAVKGAVTAGLGVSFVSSLTVPGDVLLKRLAVAALTDAKPVRRPFHVLQTSGRVARPPVKAFLAIIRKR